MSSEAVSQPSLPREQTVACLGRNCLFAVRGFKEVKPCEGATIRLLARTCQTEAAGTPGALQYAVYAQHCPEREKLGKSDEPAGYVVHVVDEQISPFAAFQAANAYQADEADEAVPVSLSYGETSLVDALPQEAPAQPENQV